MPSKPAALSAAVAIIAGAALASGCGSSSSSTSAPAPASSAPTTAAAGSAPAGGGSAIAIANFMYSPATTSVKVGTTVIVTNQDSSEHTATSNTPGGFDSGSLQQGQSARIKLTKIGTFAYHCSFHAFMHGTLKVVQ